ncbi:MAG: hypothetical protein WDN10_04950 [bacterium]
MPSLRTPEVVAKYLAHRESRKGSDSCELCEKLATKEFTYWKVVENDFPYGQIAKTHHMLVPLRHTTEDGLTDSELAEQKLIKRGFVNEGYDWIIEATHKNRSIPSHFHLHLIVQKESA